MQMCYLFMEENGATLPSGFLRDPFGISSGSVRDSFGIRSGCCILCLKNMLIDKNKSADGTTIYGVSIYVQMTDKELKTMLNSAQ